jgi:hypothetical protein
MPLWGSLLSQGIRGSAGVAHSPRVSRCPRVVTDAPPVALTRAPWACAECHPRSNRVQAQASQSSGLNGRPPSALRAAVAAAAANCSAGIFAHVLGMEPSTRLGSVVQVVELIADPSGRPTASRPSVLLAGGLHGDDAASACPLMSTAVQACGVLLGGSHVHQLYRLSVPLVRRCRPFERGAATAAKQAARCCCRRWCRCAARTAKVRRYPLTFRRFRGLQTSHAGAAGGRRPHHHSAAAAHTRTPCSVAQPGRSRTGLRHQRGGLRPEPQLPRPIRPRRGARLARACGRPVTRRDGRGGAKLPYPQARARGAARLCHASLLRRV